MRLPLPVMLAISSGLLCSGLSFGQAESSPEPSEVREAGGRKVSRSGSRQFVVYGSDSRGRGAICVFSEEVKGELLELLAQPDQWRYPIVLQIHGEASAMTKGPSVIPKIYQLAGSGFRFQANIALGRSFTRQELRDELIRLLLLEQILRAHPDTDLAGRSGMLPEWLRVGVAEAIEFRRRGKPTEQFASIFESGKFLTAAQIIHAKPVEMTSPSRAIYRASCCGLVLALVAQKHGPIKMRRMISDLAVFRGGAKALLEKHFPGTGDSQNSLEKWWALEVASMAQPTVKDILDPQETERALGRCLEVNYIVDLDKPGDAGNPRGQRKVWQIFRPKKRQEDDGAAGGDPGQKALVTADIADYRRFIDRADSAQLLAAVETRLLQLSWRAFPLHRPMIKDYQDILRLLKDGKTRDVDQRLAELAAARVSLVRSATDAADYLNWYEATQVGRRSGAFEDYKKAVEELRAPPPARTDPLSIYLDALDKEYR